MPAQVRFADPIGERKGNLPRAGREARGNGVPKAACSPASRRSLSTGNDAWTGPGFMNAGKEYGWLRDFPREIMGQDKEVGREIMKA